MNGCYFSVNKLETTLDVILFADNENKVLIWNRRQSSLLPADQTARMLLLRALRNRTTQLLSRL